MSTIHTNDDQLLDDKRLLSRENKSVIELCIDMLAVLSLDLAFRICIAYDGLSENSRMSKGQIDGPLMLRRLKNNEKRQIELMLYGEES